MDSRIKEFARMIVEYSCEVRPGDKVLIEEVGTAARPLIQQIIREVYRSGGLPFLGLSDSILTREIVKECTEEQLQAMCEYEMKRMKEGTYAEEQHKEIFTEAFLRRGGSFQ